MIKLLRTSASALLLLLGGSVATAAPTTSYAYAHRPVSTRIVAAQAAFDRGLTLVYAYQNEEAEQAFRTAARLDPGLAMAWWGIALALGPDINNAPTVGRTHQAAAAIERARLLAASHTSGAERDYIEALAARTSADAEPDFDKLAIAYRDRLRALILKHPADADAAALFAEAAMDLSPWRLWTATGEPRPGTTELVEVIERGLRHSPDHIGLLHYYIHAVEASPAPGRALLGAHRLAALHVEPAAAHLMHMPAHTFLRVGDYASAIRANEHAVHAAVDFRVSKDPSVRHACGHCLDFLTYAYGMSRQYAGARQAAQASFDLLGDPTNLIGVLALFHRDADLLAVEEPHGTRDKHGRDPHVMVGMWHYGRGVASVGRGNLDAAVTELAALDAETLLAPPVPAFADLPNVPKVYDQLTDATDGAMLGVARHVLAARIAIARGDIAGGIGKFRDAVEMQESAQYTEPPLWPYPVRDTLAAALAKSGDTAAAERVLREGLVRVPHDPVAIAGLRGILVARGDLGGAAALMAELSAAAAHADTALELERL